MKKGRGTGCRNVGNVGRMGECERCAERVRVERGKAIGMENGGGQKAVTKILEWNLCRTAEGPAICSVSGTGSVGVEL